MIAGANPCASYYALDGYHSQGNPHYCATLLAPPMCGGTPIAPAHQLYYQHCPWGYPTSCSETRGSAGSTTAHLIMYMQYNPSDFGCSAYTVAYAAQCEVDDIGRPTVGFMNWCTAAGIEAGEALLQSHVETGVHEVSRRSRSSCTLAHHACTRLATLACLLYVSLDA